MVKKKWLFYYQFSSDIVAGVRNSAVPRSVDKVLSLCGYSAYGWLRGGPSLAAMCSCLSQMCDLKTMNRFVLSLSTSSVEVP